MIIPDDWILGQFKCPFCGVWNDEEELMTTEKCFFCGRSLTEMIEERNSLKYGIQKNDI